MKIRLLTEDDAEALWHLRMEALQTDPWSFVESPEEMKNLSPAEFASRLRPSAAENFIFAADDHGKLVGMVGFYQETPVKRRHKGWIWGVFVSPAARGSGMARQLMLAVIERARKIPGLEMILLTVSVNQPVPRKLYESLGFRSFGVEPAGIKIGDRVQDEEHMVLEF